MNLTMTDDTSRCNFYVFSGLSASGPVTTELEEERVHSRRVNKVKSALC